MQTIRYNLVPYLVVFRVGVDGAENSRQPAFHDDSSCTRLTLRHERKRTERCSLQLRVRGARRHSTEQWQQALGGQRRVNAATIGAQVAQRANGRQLDACKGDAGGREVDQDEPADSQNTKRASNRRLDRGKHH